VTDCAPQRFGYPRWPITANGCNEHRRRYEFLAVACNALMKLERCASDPRRSGLDIEPIVHQRRGPVLDLKASHGERDRIARREFAVGEAEATQPLGSTPLKEPEVRGVVNSAREIRVLVIHSNVNKSS